MNSLCKHLLMAAIMSMSTCVQAAITCSAAPSTSTVSTAYTGFTGAVTNTTMGTTSFTCTRGLAGDATSILLRANQGANASATQNRARFAGPPASFINYEAYQDSSCVTLWTNNSNAASFTINMASNTSPQIFNVNFWVCVPLAQNPAAGTYSDATVTMTVRTTAGTLLGGSSTGTFAVSILTPASCSLNSVGNVAFGTYVAFRSTDLVAPNANISVTCTNNLPYTLSLDATSGVVSGLNYTLALNLLNPSSTTQRGSGAAQTHTIAGTMLVGQAGTASVGVQSSVRTLTITY